MPLPDSLFASATPLSLAAQPVLLPGQVGGGPGDTYYQVSLTGRSSVFVGLSQLSGNADLRFLDNTGVALQASANAGTASEWIETLELAVGTYYLQVTTADVEPVSYTLNGMLLAAPETSVTGQLPDASGTGGGNGSDFFSGGVWTPAPPEMGVGEDPLTPTPEGMNPDASFQLDGDGSSSLSMSGSGEDLAGNEWQSAYDTGILSGIETYSGGIGGADGIDIYRFELSEATVAGILLEGLTADLDMELYYPEDSLGWYYPKLGLQSELMQVSLDPGTYYVSIRPSLPTVSGDYVLRLVFDAAPAVPSGLTLINSPSGNATSLTPTLSGQAQPGTRVMVLYETGYPAGEATTDSQGNWTLTTETLAEGTYSFRAVAFTNEGFYSEWSAPLQVTVDQFGGSSVSEAPVLLAQLLEDTAPANQTNTDSITRKANISGRVSSSAVVAGIEVSFGLNEAFTPLTTMLNSDGSFTLTDEDLAAAYGGNLPDSQYLLRLQAIDSTGYRSNEQLIRFTLDTTAPTLELPNLIDGIAWERGLHLQGAVEDSSSEVQVTYQIKRASNDQLIAEHSIAVFSSATGATFDAAIAELAVGNSLLTSEEVYNLIVRSADAAGNVQQSTFQFFVPGERGVVDDDSWLDPSNPTQPASDSRSNRDTQPTGGNVKSWGYAGAGGYWGYYDGAIGSGSGWTPGYEGELTPTARDSNKDVGSGYGSEYDYIQSIFEITEDAIDFISTSPETIHKKGALNNRKDILLELGRRLDALIQADGDFRNDQVLIECMRPVMEGLFADAYDPQGIYSGVSSGYVEWAGAWLAQELVKDSLSVREQVFQATLLAVVTEVFTTRQIVISPEQQQALTTAVMELAKLYAWLNPTPEEAVPAEEEASGFLNELWRLQVPDASGQFRDSGGIATALQKAVNGLGQLLEGVQDPVRAMQFINNFVRAASNVPSLKSSTKDVQFLRELLKFSAKFVKLNPDITTSATTEELTDAFLDIFWKNDRARMKFGEGDLSILFEVLKTQQEGVKGLEFGSKLLEMSAYIQEPTLQDYKRNSQFLTELVKLGAAYTSLNPVAPTSNQSLNFFLDTAYRLNDMQASAHELGNFLKIVTNPDAVLYANSERLKKLKVSTDESLQDVKTSNEFIQNLMLNTFSEDSAALYSKAAKFKVRDYEGLKSQTNPLALISIDRFIDIVEKIEAVWEDDTPEQIITRLRRLYYPGDSGLNFLKGISNLLAFDSLLPHAPNYIEFQPPPVDYPTGPSLGTYKRERRVYKAGLERVDKDAYAILTAKADENGIQDNPSPYIFIPGRNEMIDIGHLLLTLDALLHPGSLAPYSDPYYNVPTIDPASWVADVGIGSVWMTLQQQGEPHEAAPKNIDLSGSIEDVIDAFFKASAPEADILGDVDGFGLFDRFNSVGRSNQPLSVHLKEYYLRTGNDIPFSVSSRWRTFADKFQAKPITGTFDIDELTEVEKQKWIDRIDRFNNLFGDGGIKAVSGQGRDPNWNWTYTKAMFDRFIDYIQEHLNR